MELKTKYQYTYFIYPYLVEKEDYINYLYRLLRKPECKIKLFNKKKHTEIDSYFLPEIKSKMFWSLNLSNEAIKDFESMDTKLKATTLSKKPVCFFDYNIKEDIPAKIGEEGGIFFDINKIEIVCFSTGICFLMLKTILNEGSSFSDVLNFNYKFRDIQSKIVQPPEYDNIKIQTNKFQNMESFSKFIEQIAGKNLKAKKVNLDTNRLITYAYVCLNEESWNENTDIETLEKEFEKYYHINSAGEQLTDIDLNNKPLYKEKYAYYGFSNSGTVLFTSASDIKNYTSLLFKYENEQLYHFIYNLYQKIYLNQLNYEFSKTNNFKNVQKEFLNFTKENWVYEVTNNERGLILEKYYKQVQNTEEIFKNLKNKYDLIYKDYEMKKSNKGKWWVLAIIIIGVIINIIGTIINVII